MGDLADDTAVHDDGGGRFSAELSPDWEIWGPNGGYLAAIALRAAAAASSQPRPAAISCHFLSVAAFGPVQLEVETLRASRRAESVRVSMHQGGTRVLEAQAWLTTPGDGLTHDVVPAPDVQPPEALPSMRERMGPSWTTFRFWDNLDYRPLGWAGVPWELPAGHPSVRNWYRYTPRATFDDPVVDAARALILLDTMSWPSARRGHPPGDLGMIAPTLDVNVQFHRAAPEEEWLLIEGVSPVGEDGLIAFSSRAWSRTGHLLASASGQMLCRPTSAPPAG